MHFYYTLLILSFIGVWVYRKLAVRMKIVDVPNERSSHTKPVARGGGVAVAGVWFAAISYMFFFGDSIDPFLYYAFLSGGLIAIAGIVDDIWSISPVIRLVTQLLAGGLALYFLGGLEKIDFGFFVIDNKWVLIPIAFIAIIWMTNLFNFLDGIDGYLGAEVIFITLVTGFMFKNGSSLAMASVMLGFLVHNWPKARIFMGDVGSTLFGFNIAVLAIYFQNTETCSIIIWVMLSSLFWFDATLTLFRRFRNKERLMQAHRKHAYQRIVQAGFSHQKTLLIAIGINIIIFGMVILSLFNTSYLLLFLVLNILLLYGIDKLIGKKNPFPKY